MRNLLKVALVLSALAPASAFAQGQLRYDGDVSSNGTLGGASVGPYQGDLSGFSPTFADDSNVILWCVDWNHAAPTQQTWDTYAATAFNGGDFSATRAASAYKYQKAAWLIEQYEANVSGYTAKNVQGSIWRLFSNNAPSSGYQNLLGLVPTNVTLTKDWFVLTDVVDCTDYRRGKCKSWENDNQEFLYSRTRPVGPPTPPFSVTPEPSTYVLMASGLLALGVASRRRRTT